MALALLGPGDAPEETAAPSELEPTDEPTPPEARPSVLRMGRNIKAGAPTGRDESATNPTTQGARMRQVAALEEASRVLDMIEAEMDGAPAEARAALERHRARIYAERDSARTGQQP